MASRSGVVAALLCAAGLTVACDAGAGEPPGPLRSSQVSASSEVLDQYTVERAAFEVTYRLDGVTQASDAISYSIPIGARLDSALSEGDPVSAGAQVGVFDVDPVASAALSAEADSGTVARSRLLALEARLGPVVAPVSGTVRVEPGGGLGVVHPGIDVTVDMSPLQELRYRGMDFVGTASVETIVGQHSVPCEALWLEVVPAVPEGAGGGARLRCRLPHGTETAPGLPAVLVLESDPLPNVTTVPAMFVSTDDDGANFVVTVDSGQEQETRPVVVGPTDGVRRVILDGVEAGDVVTSPSSEAPP